MPEFFWRTWRISVKALLRGLLYTVHIQVLVMSIIFAADYANAHLTGISWSPETGLVHLLLGMMGGVGMIETFYLNKGLSLQAAEVAAFATVPLALLVIFFIASLCDLWDEGW